jgi:TRAP-type mannitol/chloroaromatic compound transport system substrate-binding protein
MPSSEVSIEHPFLAQILHNEAHPTIKIRETSMERRKFIKAASGAAAVALTAPAMAADLPTINWRLASSFPKSLDTLFGGVEFFAKRVGELTGGKFTIRPFPAGELVPGLQVLDAVQNGTVEMGHTALYFYFGKDPAFTFETCGPFGLSSRQQMAWYHAGGGRELYQDFLKTYGISSSLPCGNTGCQMGGWFRKEIKGVEDLNGLKMRVGGFAGRILQKLGVVPQQIAAGDIYPALEKGTIDAAEFVGPYDDEKLGFDRVAPYYYTPGWWETGSHISVITGTKQWESLPAQYKAAVTAAAYEAHVHVQATYDVNNPQALARLLKRGVKLRAFPQTVMDASLKAAKEVMDAEATKNANFKKIYDSYRKFQAQQNQWYSVAESRMQNYLLNATSGGNKS